MQKIRTFGLFFENRVHWQLEVKKILQNGWYRLHIYLGTNKTLIHNSLYVFDNWGKKNSVIKICSTFTVRKGLPEGPSRSG